MRFGPISRASIAALLLLSANATAGDLLWDANGATAGQTDGGGTWTAASQWWDGGANTTWNSGTPDNAIIGNGGDGGTITIGTVSAGTVTLTNNTGRYTLDAGTLTQSGGITVGPGSAGVTISSVIAGSGGLYYDSPAKCNMNQVNTYTGTTTIARGVIMTYGQATPFGTGNLVLNGGAWEFYWGGNFTWTLGSGSGQMQLTGGRSGFSQNGLGSTVVINNNASYVVVWGSPFFKPDELILQAVTSQTSGSRNADITFQNIIDLNGATRTFRVDAVPTAGVDPDGGRVSGVIRNDAGGLPGIVKTGVGKLVLQGANTFSGSVDVQAGLLSFDKTANVASPNPLGQSSAAASNLLLSSGTILHYRGSAASCDRSFTINGTNDGAYATLQAYGTGAIDYSNTAGPEYGTPDQSRTLILDGTSTAANTLAASITDNGSGHVSLLKKNTGLWILSGNSSYKGDTTVTNGILRLSHRYALPPVTALYLYSGTTTGTVDLAFIGSQQIAALYINGVRQPNGIYGANGSTISGTGFLSPGSLGTVLKIR